MKNNSIQDFFLILEIIIMTVIVVLELCLLFSLFDFSDPFHRVVFICGAVVSIYTFISRLCDDK